MKVIIGNKGMKQIYKHKGVRLFDYAQRMGTKTVIERRPKIRHV